MSSLSPKWGAWGRRSGWFLGQTEAIQNGLRGSLCWGRVRRHRTLPQADCKVENGLFRDYVDPKRFVMMNLGLQLLISFLLIANGLGFAQHRLKVIINQDCSGPGGSNMQTLLTLIQSPQVEVLGITVVSGDQWRDEEVAHTLRLLEIIGRTDIPVVPGAVFPLVRRREEAQLWRERYGKVAYAGAWDDRWWHGPFVVPPLPEGQPKIKPAEEDAAHFLIRMVRQYPHQVTIYEGGPMTNLALAISLDPQFPELAKELVFMGGSIGPQTDNAEFINNPRHEFNFWFDPEAAHVVLRAPWK